MKCFRLLLFLIVFNGMTVIAQSNDAKQSYVQMIGLRSQKIVAGIGIADSTKFHRVQKLIADQYSDLNDIYIARDEQLKAAKTRLGDDKDGLKKETANITAQAESKIKQLHPLYLAKLSKELTPAQVDKVKDGMTYNVLHVTYDGYNQMILTLTADQQKQIMQWLVEAREYAMDAESSEKKHAWFGKYKGRINNYLSAAGYDLKKEGEEWEKRRNAAVNK